MDRFLAIDAFVRVAEARSFAEAARQMRVSRSVVTARVQQLEVFVGAPLFHRDTRSVRLSDLGQTFLRDCIELVGRMAEMVDQMREVTTSPVGRLRMHALPGFVLGHLAQLLQEFQTHWPQIVLEIVVNDAAIDPVEEGFDCALQIFPPQSEELVSRELFPVRRVFCASPTYLRRSGTPREPRELLTHRIGWYSGYPTRERVGTYGVGVPGAGPAADAAEPRRAPAARVRTRACRQRLPADAGGVQRGAGARSVCHPLQRHPPAIGRFVGPFKKSPRR